MKNLIKNIFSSLLFLLLNFSYGQSLCDLQLALENDLYKSDELLETIYTKPELIDSWKNLHLAGSKFVKTNPTYLQTFNKLSPENQKLIALFTDDKAGSTLTKFLDDCDDEFLKLLDDEPKYLECFLSHKTSSNWTISQYDEFAETILSNNNLSDIQLTKLTKWLDHSSTASKFGNVTRKGIDLSSNILTSLGSRSGKLFHDLASKLGIDPVILKQYDIYYEVPLLTEGGFMKADVVLVKRGVFGYDDVIVIENKLSSTTDYTVRQKEGWKKLANGENLEVKYKVDGIDDTGSLISLNSGDSFAPNKVRTYKISDHGETNISNVDISEIPVNNWRNYTYTPK